MLQKNTFSFIVKVLGYVKLAFDEGGTIMCGEGKDTSLNLPSPHTEVNVSLNAKNVLRVYTFDLGRDLRRHFKL